MVHRKKKIQSAATELFKPKTGMLIELMNDIFHFVENPYNLRCSCTLE